MPYRSFCPSVVYHIIHTDGIDTTEISDSISFTECLILTLSGLGSALQLLPVKTECRVSKSLLLAAQCETNVKTWRFGENCRRHTNTTLAWRKQSSVCLGKLVARFALSLSLLSTASDLASSAKTNQPHCTCFSALVVIILLQRCLIFAAVDLIVSVLFRSCILVADQTGA